jgi:hypothetical protein
MHDDDQLDPSHDALTRSLDSLMAHVAEVTEAAKIYAASERTGLEDLEHGRPLLHDLRYLARTLAALGTAFQDTADHVERMILESVPPPP